MSDDAEHFVLQDPEDYSDKYSKILQKNDKDVVDRVPEGEGCPICGGLGHRVADCPKMMRNNVKKQGKDFSGGDW